MGDKKANIVRAIENIGGRYTPYQIFTDWVHMMALSIVNGCTLFHDAVWQQREEEYLTLIKRYDGEEQERLCEMFAWLTELCEEEITDVLGQIYMESGCGNKATGQFFTPFHLSLTMAQARLSDIGGSKPIELYEPSCGGGGMLIAAAKVLHDRGIDYQRRLHVVAQDLDWNGVYMTYVQLSLYGIKAVVAQGNTLADPYRAGYPAGQTFRTPGEVGVLL